MKCGYCGKVLKDDAQFCSNCGRNLHEIDNEPSVSKKAARSAYAFSVCALILVISIVALGGYVIILRDLHPKNTVSASDDGSYHFNYDSSFTDAALTGRWFTADRAVRNKA